MSFDATKKLPTVALIIASRRQAAVHSCHDKSHATDLLLFMLLLFFLSSRQNVVYSSNESVCFLPADLDDCIFGSQAMSSIM